MMKTWIGVSQDLGELQISINNLQMATQGGLKTTLFWTQSTTTKGLIVVSDSVEPLLWTNVVKLEPKTIVSNSVKVQLVKRIRC